MSRNFLNAFITDRSLPGIKLLDRSARRLGIELTSRGRPASACSHVVPRSAAVLVWGRSDPGDRLVFGLPVGSIDGREVSRDSFCPQGGVRETRGRVTGTVTRDSLAPVLAGGIRIVGSRPGAPIHAGAVGLVSWI